MYNNDFNGLRYLDWLYHLHDDDRKTIVFGLLKRDGKVYIVPVADVKQKTLLPVIQQKIKPDSVVYMDGHTAYNALDISEFTHFRINHSKECEWRFNEGSPKQLLDDLKNILKENY